jgi:hypothetical protein
MVDPLVWPLARLTLDEDGETLKASLHAGYNDDMVLEVDSPTLVGRTDPERGPAQAITVAAPLRLEDKTLYADIPGVEGIQVWYDGDGPPAAELGNVGDYYLDHVSGDVYHKHPTWAVVASLKGPQGDQGWIDGDGAPAAGLGHDGDYYLNNLSGDVYHKVPPWTIVANITGPIGPEGPSGPGTGDVIGDTVPVTTGRLAKFNDTTGKHITQSAYDDAHISGLVTSDSDTSVDGHFALFADGAGRHIKTAGYGLGLPETHSGAYSVAAADRGKTFLVSGSWTLGHTVTAAQAGAGFSYRIKNTGVATVTIDPNGSETIEAAATLKCRSKEEFEVVCDGANWFALGRRSIILLSRTDAGSVASIDVSLPPDYDYWELEYDLAATANSALLARLAIDGVPNFITSANYYYDLMYSLLAGAGGASAEGLAIAYWSIGRGTGLAGGRTAGVLRTYYDNVARMDGYSMTTYSGGGQCYVERHAGMNNIANGPATHLRFYRSAGNIYGKIIVRGHLSL